MKVLDRGADLTRRPAAFREPLGIALREAEPHRRLGADGYSLAVGFLKRILPVIGIALLLLVAAWPRIAPLLVSVRLSASGIDPREARELKMLNPRYAGTDRLNRPYVVTAAVGRQSPDRNSLMSLEKPRAVMIVHGGVSVVLTAATAIYQAQPQLLDLFDNVVLTHQNGTRFVTQRAHADLPNSTAEGHVPIEGHGPSGDIWGQGFRVLDKGDTIIFTGRSRAILRSTKPSKPPPAPPEPPTEILHAAARVEAAAIARESPHPAAVPARPDAMAPAADDPVPPAPHPAAIHHFAARSHHIYRRAGIRRETRRSVAGQIGYDAH
jgi:lipopolysaccharide export system protein LptC